MSGNLGTLTVTLNANVEGLNRAITEFQNFEKTTVASINRMSQRFRTFGYLSSAAITLPIVAAGKASFKMAEDFEFSMQKIVGLAGVGQNVVDQWRQSILKMGPELAQTPQALAESLYFIASSGIKGAEALDVLQVSAKAASSGMGDVKSVADFLTSALNAYKGTGLTAAKATDILVAAVREGKAEAAGFSSAMGSVIPIAALLNVSLDQVAGAMAAITLTGSTAAQAATYLKGMFNNLMKGSETGAGAKALDSIKTSYAQLRDILKNQGIIPMLEKVRAGMGQYGDTLVAKVFPNIRAMTAVLSIAGKNFKYNSEIMDKVTNSAGSLGIAWAAVSNTIKIRFDKAISQANVSLITLGQSVATTVIPLLEGLVKRLTTLTNHFSSLTDSQKRHRIEFLMWVAALGPASLLIAVVGYSISGIISVLGALKIAFIATKGFILAQPWVTLAVAIGVAALAIINFAKKLDEIPARLQKLKDSMKGLAADEPNINDKMSLMFMMDKGQVQELQNILQQRLEVFKNDRIELVAYRNSWFTEDKNYIKLQERLQFDLAALEKWKAKPVGFNQRITVNQFTKDVIADRKAIQDYMSTYESGLGKSMVGVDEKIKGTEEALKKVATRLKDFPTNVLQTAEEVVAETTKKIEEQSIAADRLAEAWQKAGNYINAAFSLIKNGMDKDLWTMMVPPDKKDVLKNYIGVGFMQSSKANRPFRIPNNQYQSFDVGTNGINNTSQDWLKPLKPYTFADSLKLNNKGVYSETATIMKKLGEEMAFINIKSDALGISIGKHRQLFDVARAKVNALSNALEDLMNAKEKGPAWQVNVNKTIDDLEKMQKEFDKIQTRRDFLNGITDTFSSFFMNIMQGTKSVAAAFKEMGNSIIQSFEKMIADMIAKKIAGFLMNLLFPGAGTAMSVASQAGSAVGLSMMGFAKGGVVPQGYPNDSYPALLTSGETVLPKSFNFSNLASQSISFEPVEIVIKDNTMTGFLKKINKKNNLY
jgi:TP901 family phage tail tape measure protein